MAIGPFIIELFAYSLALWLGMYLIARDPTSPRLRSAGFGLISYALSLGSSILANKAAAPALVVMLTRLHWPLLFFPAIFWFRAALYLLPETAPLRKQLGWLRDYSLLLLAVPFYLVSVNTNLIFDFTTKTPQAGPIYPIFAGLVLLPMLITLLLIGRLFKTGRPKKSLGILLVASLFFTLGAGLLSLPLNWLPRTWLLLMLGLDILALGLIIAWLDAFDQGEILLPDFARAFDAAFLMVILFGGPIVLTMILSTGPTFPMTALLMATISSAIVTQVFVDPIQNGLDAVALRAFPHLRQARADLRLTATVLPRVNASFNLEATDEEEFARLTRWALSHMGNLPRLATTPLTRLSLIEARLRERQANGDTLERAAELKRLLTESICRLKPPGKGDFGLTEEWRHYNALYFPYVVGLKPYSRRIEHDGLEPAAQEALEWFRTYVPERTLYNWQNAAAELVAQDLRERHRRLVNGQ